MIGKIESSRITERAFIRWLQLLHRWNQPERCDARLSHPSDYFTVIPSASFPDVREVLNIGWTAQGMKLRLIT